MKKISKIVMMVCCLYVYVLPMICEKQSKNILDTFNRVLYFPLEAKKKKGLCIANVMSKITESDYKTLARQYPEKSKHLEQSFLWSVAGLPKETQKQIILFMMETDDIKSPYCKENAVGKFLISPFLYAMDRYSRVRQCSSENGILSDFMTMNIYKKEQERKQQRKIFIMAVLSIGGELCCLPLMFFVGAGPASMAMLFGGSIGLVGSIGYNIMSE